MEPSPAKYSLLIVEDDSMARELMRRMLRRIAHTTFEASDGKQGLELCLEHLPDAVVTDLEMPVMNGWEMLERIKEQNPDQPVVVVTAFADEASEVPLADQVIVKPIVKARLFEAIEKAIHG
ncbi:response regulator [Desulfurispira natronophila]|uniref:CheY-like chemotaxis protein n=1 Tax=Desulfurispira natronophila TaxID=682562 RepID=A0A7W7Y4M1_9BACT|nr:response regulator [Desulfurispira natronophila]MBB5021995.1 CheY-like chemotaxis protein [Desulfurispira natronophila]